MQAPLHHKDPPIQALLKSKSSLIVLTALLVLFVLPALACNLPARGAAGLAFPTSLPATTGESLLFPTGELPRSSPVSPLSTPSAGSSLPLQPTIVSPQQPSATPVPAIPTPLPTADPAADPTPFSYVTQPGDTLPALASRFGVRPERVSPPQPTQGLLTPGQLLTIPNEVGAPPYSQAALPDSLVVYSPEAAGFSIEDYITQAGGFLNTHQEYVNNKEWLTGSEIVRRVAENTSVNPKVLLAFLEFRSGWVRGQPYTPQQEVYPIGFYVPEYKGLYLELSLVAKQLNIGYYGWRDGSLTALDFPDGSRVRLSPGLNAGSVAVQMLTSRFYLSQHDWEQSLYGPEGFLKFYQVMFGDPWHSAASVEPLFPPGLAQPELQLPFTSNSTWSLTAGPHISWNTGTPAGALDFSPIILQPPCETSYAWATASASGLVVRTGEGLLVLDLDGDGLEQTGWVLVYMHVAEKDRAPIGAWVDVDVPFGHPSCEGGKATGTHLHIARKYNGEWIAADGPLPMVLSGWVAHNGARPYQGTLEKAGQVVTASPDGLGGSAITR